MRLIFWVTALAVLSIASAKNATAKAKPKRQLDNIRTQQNLQYSLVLPHSRVQHFRALTNSRRVAHVPTKGKLPPYAVQMEPVVQYSQKDPLYDPTQDNQDDTVVNKNEIYAQSKILNVDQSEESYEPAYGTLPTAPLYGNEPHRYYEEPEPIIEIIIKESNETLPAPPPPPVQKKKKEPVHVFYVKYSKDPHSKNKVIYEKPIPAITPATNDEEDHHEYVTVTPEPYLPPKTTTLRAIIKPESEVYHSDSSVKITFGQDNHNYGDRRESHSHSSEEHEETAPKPALAFPNTPLHPTHQTYPQLERSVPPKSQHLEANTRPSFNQPEDQSFYRTQSFQPENRLQFHPHQNIPNEQQLPRQGPSLSPFKSQSSPITSRIPFGPTPTFNAAFSNGPIGVPHFVGPAVPSPSAFPPPAFPRNGQDAFRSRQNNPPTFAPRPPQFNGPSRASFHSGPQRPFPSQSKNYFDDPKYLQENYHTITTEQVDPPKHQNLPNRPQQSFNPHPSQGPNFAQFQEQRRPLVLNQQLPQQRPAPPFLDINHNKPLSIPNPSASPFFNLKPSPPLVENNRPPFHQPPQSPQQQFSFHQGPQIPLQHQNTLPGPISLSPSPSPLPPGQFVPQPSSPPLYSFQPRPSPTPEVYHHHSPSEKPQFEHHGHGPSERPFNNDFRNPSNFEHQQNVGSLVQNGGELVPAISKYEQHITVNGPMPQTYGGFVESSPSQPSISPSQQDQRYYQQQNQYQKEQQQQAQQREKLQLQEQREHQRQQEQRQQEQRQQEQRQRQQQQEQRQRQQQQEDLQRQHQQELQQRQHQQEQQKRQRQEDEQRQQLQQHQQQQQDQQHIQQQQYHDEEQEQVRLQLAQNVQKQQEEIQRLQAQLQQVSQQQLNYRQHAQQETPSRSQYTQERSRPQPSYSSSTSSPAYYQSTSRTIEIKPTTPKYVSSTQNSISTTPDDRKEEKKKKASYELPDEVPDDLRQQLLSSGILDNADISVLDYDKVGDTPLDSLPPDQLANFFSAGGGQQIASSENRPVYVKADGDSIQSRADKDVDDDQEFAASENAPYVTSLPNKQAVEMKVVHFNPDTPEGQSLAKEYIKENATQVDPVALNDKKYNRYLPLKVSGNQFPLPDILKGRKVTSVVVLAPVETEVIGDHKRKERSASENLKGIKFVAGDSLQELLRRPTKDNFEKWLEVEKKTASDLQSVVLLVTSDSDAAAEKEIFMYDIGSGNVNKINGELSNAFVEAAENNSLTKDIESLAIEGEGTPENFNKDAKDGIDAEGSENVPLLVDISGLSLEHENSNQVSISSGYSKTKRGRSAIRHS